MITSIYFHTMKFDNDFLGYILDDTVLENIVEYKFDFLTIRISV